MSRAKKKGPRQITIHLSEELSYALDNWATSFGLESRAAALHAMAMAGNAAVPIETAVYELVRAGVAETRKAEFEALANHYQTRADLYRSPT